MAKVILTLDDAILGEFQLDKERTTIGRRSISDIHIDNLAISGEHAVILHVGQDFYLEDVGSTNGTRINGKLIKKQLLQHEDVITLAKYQLKYLNEAALIAKTSVEVPNTNDGAHSNDLADELQTKQAVISTPTAIGNETPLASVASSPATEATLATAKIKLLNGSNAGRELTLNKALTTLGKVGAQVAVINRRPHGYFITHIEGKVFPVVNGNSIGAQAFALKHEDVIELAGVKMLFCFSL